MPNKQDTDLLEYLRTHKSSHVRLAVQKIHASFEASSSFMKSATSLPSGVPAAPTTPVRRTTVSSTPTTNSAVKRHVEHLERKIIEQSETTTRNESLLSLSPRSHQRTNVSPRYAFSPKQLYHKAGWDNDDDTTVSTVSISSMSMSSLSVDRPIMEIRFERSSLGERPSTNMFRSSPSSDAICKIEHISILDAAFDGAVSYAQTLSTSRGCPSETTSSNEAEEGPEKGVFHYYFVLSVLLLSAKGVDPFVVCTIYLW
eukprot:CAMPEP_0113422814 /NCGR_PEP_ID=MMETSP0013_2-20120614/28664_1 /TAXON_ID=2843 ORGANISM="Skeletonema costatum, Strain 1716" /NCGR_SAMPLE_ID=MMETSP0013_2 /ASSEMBLY_ACC=CAM_ASM_000158 /LENGTH=256 /DNA_ID=CAMNT_0000310589 /DNA_START=179 /DNA_END=946 /DNA_ORIENTATION=+ /assembly_acc=CAM_ASM_000158